MDLLITVIRIIMPILLISAPVLCMVAIAKSGSPVPCRRFATYSLAISGAFVAGLLFIGFLLSGDGGSLGQIYMEMFVLFFLQVLLWLVNATLIVRAFMMLNATRSE